MNRWAILEVSGEFLVEMAKHGSPRHVVVTANALPEDARIVGYDHDYTGRVFLILESETFDEAPQGTRLPVLESPVFRVVHEDETKPA